MHHRFFKRTLTSFFLAAALMAGASSAFAEGAVTSLFKIVTVKDEIIVALAQEEGASIPTDAPAVGRALVSKGSMAVWQYAVRKGKDGELEIAPLKKISILAHDSVRVEPYSSPLRVVPME